MELRTIFEDNIDEYSGQIDQDVAENMGRMYYHGIAVHDPEDHNLLSLLIWKLKSMENGRDHESELQWIYAIDSSCIAPLLEGYHKEALNEDVKRTVFESTTLGEEEAAAFEADGFSAKSVESRDIEVTIEECRNLSITKKDAPLYVQSLLFLDYQEFYQGLMNILFRYDDPGQEDLAYLPKEWYEQSVSCFTKTDGKVTGFLLVHACPSGVLIPVLYFAVGADFRINLIEMMRFSINRAADIYPGDTVIRIHRRNQETRALSGKLFPNKKGAPAVAGERAE